MFDANWLALVRQYAGQYGLPEGLIYGIGERETGWDQWAQGDGGCSCGPLQINWCGGPGQGYTCQELMEDLGLSFRLACERLRYLYTKYGRWDLTARYYRGEAEDQWSQPYQDAVLANWQHYDDLYGGVAPPPSGGATIPWKTVLMIAGSAVVLLLLLDI